VVALTGRERVLVVVCILYAATAIPVGVHNGADIKDHMPQVQRLINRQPLYTTPPSVGVWWPPFALLALTPVGLLARLSLSLAKAAFSLVQVAFLWWTLARFAAVRGRHLVLAIAAVSVPLENNFEWLNWNAILLALLVASALDFTRHRDARAGAWLGLATALKMFPALLLLFAAYRGRWRAAASGAGVAVAVTLLALVPLGVPGAVASIHNWLARSATGAWELERQNQSLPAVLGRAGLPPVWGVGLGVALVVLAGLVLRRPTAHHDFAHDLGIVTLLAILVTPIAWIHYYWLAFPAWIGAISRAPLARHRLAQVALAIAGVATSGLMTIWGYPLRVVLQVHSIYAWGGLVLLAVLLVERLPRGAASVSRGDA
jgi:alpha-1,2-mannosyltransferase